MCMPCTVACIYRRRDLHHFMYVSCLSPCYCYLQQYSLFMLLLQNPCSLVQRRPTNYSQRLSKGWVATLHECDHSWVGQLLFVSKGNMAANLVNWWNPPPVRHNTKPSLPNYFARRLFLWMPRKMWRMVITCPHCGVDKELRSKDVYHHVRRVVDISDMYYLAAEYMDCRACSGIFIAWDQRILEQLPDGVRARFPVVLTYKYACDKAVIVFLRARTLGNSPGAMKHNLQELHSEEHLRKVSQYLHDCDTFRSSRSNLGMSVTTFQPPPQLEMFRSAKWFLAAYVRDVWSRLRTLKAAVTSTFGEILKIDSTKKVCRKLQGASVNMAAWATNVGNERGEVLITVLTESESAIGLQRMASGLVDRYCRSGKPRPLVLYTDRDCCTMEGLSKLNALFAGWDGLPVRLDVWHFMRRLAGGVTSESHPLYGIFMQRLSGCIFEWDAQDHRLLLSAKKSMMVAAGMMSPSEVAVRKAVTRDELARHCRRKTRGTDATVTAIENLLLSLTGATDSLGVLLLKDEMTAIWAEQRKHVACLQDPEGVNLYTVTGSLKKGDVRLPVLRCARGTTSLESFHLHLARFIPGTSANATNFHAYLLDGITRWNAKREKDAVDAADTPLRTFDVRLQYSLNELSRSLGMPSLFEQFRVPMEYTGEAIGVDYLFQQTDMAFPKDITAAIDEGFDDMVEDDTSETDAMEDIDSAPVELPVDPEEGDVKVTHSHNSHVCTCSTLQRQHQHVMTIHHKLPRHLRNCVFDAGTPRGRQRRRRGVRLQRYSWLGQGGCSG